MYCTLYSDINVYIPIYIHKGYKSRYGWFWGKCVVATLYGNDDYIFTQVIQVDMDDLEANVL